MFLQLRILERLDPRCGKFSGGHERCPFANRRAICGFFCNFTHSTRTGADGGDAAAGQNSGFGAACAALSVFRGGRFVTCRWETAGLQPAATGTDRLYWTDTLLIPRGMRHGRTGSPHREPRGRRRSDCRPAPGDPTAYEEVVRRHSPRMLATARRILHNEEDTHDAVQDAFLSAFKSLDSFEGQASWPPGCIASPSTRP